MHSHSLCIGLIIIIGMMSTTLVVCSPSFARQFSSPSSSVVVAAGVDVAEPPPLELFAEDIDPRAFQQQQQQGKQALDDDVDADALKKEALFYGDAKERAWDGDETPAQQQTKEYDQEGLFKCLAKQVWFDCEKRALCCIKFRSKSCTC